MYMTKIRIRNFRGLEDIEFSPSLGVNVLTGPNAVGKTSILEAIRLTKTFLAPRYREESSHALISLGATTKHMLFGEGQVDFSALAGVPSSPLEVKLDISLSSSEIEMLKCSKLSLAQALVRSQIGQERASTQLDLIQFMSSESGKEQLKNAETVIDKYIEKVDSCKGVSLILRMELIGQALQINSLDTNAQLVIQTLEGACTPSTALFSYFPADRALPSGEVAIQIGSADMQQQVFSHIGQPAIKYSRLKQIIINAFILGDESQSILRKYFDVIFDQLLPGKKLEIIQQKPTGNLSVLIKDLKSNRLFDIDNMSSGEKGLILTFLLLRNNTAKGGIVLLDEPELHLNPAVCDRLVSFLQSEIITPLELQVLVCTHSAEILSSALHSDICSVFHLRTASDITPVDSKDKAEVFEILRRLGLSSMDVLNWQGTVFVEGVDDMELLSLGFPELLSRYQIKELGGRAEIEKEIKQLQSAETKGNNQRLDIFVFDNDRKPTSLESTPFVRILQWERYSIESYLLDVNLLFPIIHSHAEIKVESKGVLLNLLRDIAMEQLNDEVIRRIYEELEPENCELRNRDIIGKSFEDCASMLFDKIDSVRQSIKDLERSSWTTDFSTRCQNLEKELRADWETNWRARCNSKRLFKDLQKRQKLKVSVAFMKSAIMKEMRLNTTEDWKLMKSLLSQAIDRAESIN